MGAVAFIPLQAKLDESSSVFMPSLFAPFHPEFNTAVVFQVQGSAAQLCTHGSAPAHKQEAVTTI
jgi:hypothetical protein